ncbi:MAG: DsbA family protein [Sporolactobacillus sp.]
MSNQKEHMFCEGTLGNMTCSITHPTNYIPKVEILCFIDPLCPLCWSTEPMMKKLILEYHKFFTFRYIMTTQHDTANRFQFYHAKQIAEQWDRCARLTGMCCDSDIWFENPPSPYSVALAIKAAEFQGQNASYRFLRRIREQVFLRKEGLCQFEDFLDAATFCQLNIDEFATDFHSCRSIKAIQSDRKLANELSITELPSLVYSTSADDSEAIRISGRYDYPVYVQILKELIPYSIEPSTRPPLIDYFAAEHILTTREVSVIYDWSVDEALIQLRKLQIKNLIQPIELKSGIYWKHINN